MIELTPFPPTPTKARFSFSLGECEFPVIMCGNATILAAVAPAAVLIKERRFISEFSFFIIG